MKKKKDQEIRQKEDIIQQLTVQMQEILEQ